MQQVAGMFVSRAGRHELTCFSDHQLADWVAQGYLNEAFRKPCCRMGIIAWKTGLRRQRTSHGRQRPIAAQGVASLEAPTKVAEKSYKLGGKYDLKVGDTFFKHTREVCPRFGSGNVIM